MSREEIGDWVLAVVVLALVVIAGICFIESNQHKIGSWQTVGSNPQTIVEDLKAEIAYGKVGLADIP